MNNIIERIWKQGGLVNIEDLRGTAFQAEESAHTFRIRGVDESGEPLALTGTCAAIFLRADNTDVAITGTITDGAAEITLTDECYDMPGRFGLTIYVTSEEQTVAVYAAIGSVCRTSSGTVSPETGEDVMDLINAINDAIEDLEEAIAKIPEDYQELEDDVAALQSDVEDIQGDVETLQGTVEDIQEDVGDLQGKTNDYAPVIINDASGEIVSIPDGAGDMKVKELVVNIEPVQDLHGYDNPWPAGGGKNLYPSGDQSFTQEKVITLNKDIPAGTYMFSALVTSEITSGSCNVVFIDTSNNTISRYITPNTGSRTAVGSAVEATNPIHQIILRSGGNYSQSAGISATYKDIQIESGSSATSYAPYENSCPISGWDSANVGVAEHYSPLRPDAVTTFTDHGVTYDVSKYPFIKASGTATGGSAYSGMIGTTYQSFRLPAGTHTLKAIGNIDNAAATFQFETGSGLSNTSITKDNPSITFTLTAEYGIGWYLVTNNGKTTDSLFALVYEEGQAYEYDFPQEAGEVPGGKLTIWQDGTGELVVDRASVDLGTLDYTKYDVTQGTLFRGGITGIKTISFVSIPNMICSAYPVVDTSLRTNKTVSQAVNNPSVDIVDNDYSDASTFKTAMSGVQLVYELATPVVYNLTAQDVISLLKGNNNLWADCGNISIEYPADTKLYIDGKIAEIQALILENISNS